MPFLYKYGREIIENAKKIICISKSQETELIHSSFFKKLRRETIDKIVVCPNGIDDFWHDNLYQKRRIACKNFVYIGIFDDDKNVVRLIEAFNFLKQEFKEINFQNKIDSLSSCNSWWLLDHYQKQKVKDFKKTNLCKDKFCNNFLIILIIS